MNLRHKKVDMQGVLFFNCTSDILISENHQPYRLVSQQTACRLVVFTIKQGA
jgi:hypothetical protein